MWKMGIPAVLVVLAFFVLGSQAIATGDPERDFLHALHEELGTMHGHDAALIDAGWAACDQFDAGLDASQIAAVGVNGQLWPEAVNRNVADFASMTLCPRHDVTRR